MVPASPTAIQNRIFVLKTVRKTPGAFADLQNQEEPGTTNKTQGRKENIRKNPLVIKCLSKGLGLTLV